MDISTYKNPRIKTKEILFLKTDFVKKHLKKTEILKREIEKSRTRFQHRKREVVTHFDAKHIAF